MKKITKLWAETNKQIEELRDQTLRAERLYLELRNWVPLECPIEIENPATIRIDLWPRDISPHVLFQAGTPGQVITTTPRFFMYVTNGICVSVTFKEEDKK